MEDPAGSLSGRGWLRGAGYGDLGDDRAGHDGDHDGDGGHRDQHPTSAFRALLRDAALGGLLARVGFD